MQSYTYLSRFAGFAASRALGSQKDEPRGMAGVGTMMERANGGERARRGLYHDLDT